jgi:hypothetical protein
MEWNSENGSWEPVPICGASGDLIWRYQPPFQSLYPRVWMDGEVILVWAGIREALGGNLYTLPPEFQQEFGSETGISLSSWVAGADLKRRLCPEMGVYCWYRCLTGMLLKEFHLFQQA